MINSRLGSLLIFGACLSAWLGGLFIYRAGKPSARKMNTAQKIICKEETNLFKHFISAMGMYFWGHYPETWQRGIEPTKQEKKEQRKLFGYNLRIEHIIDNDPSIVKTHNRPTLFLHGWGDTKGGGRLLKAYCDVLPGDVITFNFRDRGVIIPKLQHSSLGQMFDVQQALYALKWAKNNLKLDAIDLFGYSRGGATTVNMIAVLNDKTGVYDEDLAYIGIDAKERKDLLRIIQNGCIVLNCPLRDLESCAQQRFHNFAPKALKALEFVSHYNRNGMQAMHMAEKLQGLNLKILLHVQYNDKIVPNEGEGIFYQRLYEHNPRSTYLVLGNDGGHLHSHNALSNTIHVFKKMYGSSYDPAYVDQYQSYMPSHSYEARLLRPGIKSEQCIDNYYASCASAHAQ